MSKYYLKLLCLIVLLVLVQCKKSPARKPLNKKVNTNTFINKSIKRNKIILNNEVEQIKKEIAIDSLHQYQNSTAGYWYTYIKRSDNIQTPKKSDMVMVNYEVRDIHNQLIYPAENIGDYIFSIDEQDALFIGMHQIIKTMHVGDEIKAFFPSSIAYGYHGDEHLIGTNQSILCKIKLKKINQKINK